MIQPIMLNKNVSFGNSNAQQAPKEGFFTKAKKGCLNVAKTFNNVTNISAGAARGVAEGAALAGAIALVGKNCAKNEGITFKSVKGILGDIVTAGKTVIKHIPDAIVKSPLENVKTLFTSAWNGAKVVAKGVKNHKTTTAIAAIAGFATVAARVIQGRVRANLANAQIDHATNNGHK